MEREMNSVTFYLYIVSVIALWFIKFQGVYLPMWLLSLLIDICHWQLCSQLTDTSSQILRKNDIPVFSTFKAQKSFFKMSVKLIQKVRFRLILFAI